MKQSNRSRRSQLVISIAVCLGSLGGAWWLIESTKITESYLITKSDMATGTPLLVSELREVELAMFATGERYLTSQQVVSGYLLRPIAAGELIPLTAIALSGSDQRAHLVVTPSVAISSLITPGRTVALWAAPQLDFGSFGEPVLLAVDAEVVKVIEPQSAFALSAVELRIASESVGYVLRSIASGDALAVVDAGG